MDLQKHEFIYFQLYEQKPQALPTNIIIKNGELVYYKAGFLKESIDKLEAKLVELCPIVN